jgi:hypothetical protein
MRQDGAAVDLAQHVWERKGRPDVLVLAGHVLGEHRRGVAVGVVGRRDAALLDDDVRRGWAVLERVQDVGRGLRGGRNRRVCAGQEQAVVVSLAGSGLAWTMHTRRWRRGRRATCCGRRAPRAGRPGQER